MPASRGGLPLERLREAVAGGVEATSLRQVARAVGMSPSGLQKFLDGATPYSGTRRKLERWYVRESAVTYGAELGGGTALAALRVLTQDLPAHSEQHALEEILASLEHAHRVAHRSMPGWLREVREELERRREP